MYKIFIWVHITHEILKKKNTSGLNYLRYLGIIQNRHIYSTHVKNKYWILTNTNCRLNYSYKTDRNKINCLKIKYNSLSHNIHFIIQYKA